MTICVKKNELLPFITSLYFLCKFSYSVTVTRLRVGLLWNHEKNRKKTHFTVCYLTSCLYSLWSPPSSFHLFMLPPVPGHRPTGVVVVIFKGKKIRRHWDEKGFLMRTQMKPLQTVHTDYLNWT